MKSEAIARNKSRKIQRKSRRIGLRGRAAATYGTAATGAEAGGGVFKRGEMLRKAPQNFQRGIAQTRRKRRGEPLIDSVRGRQAGEFRRSAFALMRGARAGECKDDNLRLRSGNGPCNS